MKFRFFAEHQKQVIVISEYRIQDPAHCDALSSKGGYFFMETITRKLVLIRHAKAGSLKKDKSDSQRKLTRKGIEDIRKILPVIKEYLAANDDLRLYASNKARSFQTAEIIASSLKMPETIRADWVSSGKTKEFVNLIREMPGDVCIIVGHEPFLGEWSQLLCGYRISFYKGMAVGFQLTPEDKTFAVPVWAVHPGASCLKDVNVSSDRPALKVLENFVHFMLNEILLLQHEFDERPNEPETVHQLRIKIRSLRSMLSFMKPLLEQEKYQTIQKNLQNLLRETGHLRDLDVFINRWDTRTDNRSKQQSREYDLIAILKKEREIAVTESHKKLSLGLYPVVFELWNWMNEKPQPIQLDKSAAGQNGTVQIPSFQKFCNMRLNRWTGKIKKKLNQYPFSDEKSIHNLRIHVKKLRYIFSYFGDQKHIRHEIPMEYLSRMQDLLGEYCDMKNSISILKALNTQYESLNLQSEIIALTNDHDRLATELVSYVRAIGLYVPEDTDK